jgi:hypothetical protein
MTLLLIIFARLLCAAVPDALATSPQDLAPDWHATCVEIATRAAAMGIDPAIPVSVSWHENRLGRYGIGAAGEVGPMQVMPIWMRACDGDAICGGLVAVRHYVSRYPDGAHWCRYRGAPAGCASERLRGGLAMRLRGGASW